MKTITLCKEEIYSGYLILVNRKHPISHSNLSKVLKLVPFLTEHKVILLERRTAVLLTQLIKSVRCSNEIVPVSGYRSKQEQEKIFTDSLTENGRAFTERYVAYPDCSEHQTGLAIDLAENQPNIDFIRPSFPYTGIYAEFRKKATECGFVERYEEGKEEITGISHEPWHFRYVGYPHAQIMQQHKFCLEEYIQFLRDYPFEGQHFTFKAGDKNYDISYVRAEDGQTTIKIPENNLYQISGNNVDGFIVTIWGNHL